MASADNPARVKWTEDNYGHYIVTLGQCHANRLDVPVPVGSHASHE